MGMYEEVRIYRATEQLLKEREEKARYGDFPADMIPPTIMEGYRIQTSVMRKLMARGNPLGGWKVALASKTMQQAQGVTHPVCGPVLNNWVLTGDSEVSATDYGHLCVEAEIAFRIATPLAQGQGLWTAENVKPHIAAAMVAIEIADDRYARQASFKSLPLLIADFAHNYGAVLGPDVTEWQDIDLAAEELTITMNDTEIGCGAGSAVLGHPLNSLAWLANALNERFTQLEPDQIVLTGCVTETAWLGAGEDFIVESPNLGRVALNVTD